MKNVTPLKPREVFACAGIDWTRNARTERERLLREAFLTCASSCSVNGLASLLLVSAAARRQGTIAEDLRDAADLAEIALASELHDHLASTLAAVESHVATHGAVWT